MKITFSVVATLAPVALSLVHLACSVVHRLIYSTPDEISSGMLVIKFFLTIGILLLLVFAEPALAIYFVVKREWWHLGMAGLAILGSVALFIVASLIDPTMLTR